MSTKTIEEVKTEIDVNVNTNGERRITGSVMNTTLNDMMDAADDAKADTTGYYEGLSVGLADNLISPDGVEDQDAWIYRSTAGSQDVSSGFATLRSMKGNTIVWNQLVGSSTESVTLASGKKYITVVSGTWSDITTGTGSSVSVTGGTDMVFDLTLMFGSGNEPENLSDFTNMFSLNYYSYDAGSLLSFNPTTLQTVGFNQYDSSKQTANVHVLGENKYKIKGTYTGLKYSDNTNVSITNGYFTTTKDDYLTLTGGNAVDTCVHLSWSGYRDGDDDYEAYWNNNLDLSWITSIESGSTALFPNGLMGIGTVCDEVTETNAVKRIGTQTVTGTSGGTVTLTGCDTTSTAYVSALGNIGTLSGATLTLTTTVTDVVVAFVLASPITLTFETAKSLNYKEDDFGTEQLLNSSASAGVPGLCIPHEVTIKYQSNLRDKIRRLDDNYVGYNAQTPTERQKETARKNIGAISETGAYPLISAGNLISDTEIGREFSIDVIGGGGAEIGYGYADIKSVKGNSIVWNQLVDTGTSAVTLQTGVKYLAVVDGNKAIVTGANEPIPVTGGTDMIFNLTKMFGSGNEVSINEFNKLFPNPYYPYCGGRLVSFGGYQITWNQLVNTSTTTVTLTTDHKFITDISSVRTLTTGDGTGVSVTGGTDMVFDLTLMFGAGAEATLTEFNTLFGTDYYPYDAGTLMNVTTKLGIESQLSVETIGFNIFNGNKTDGYTLQVNGEMEANTGTSVSDFMKVIPGQTYYVKSPSGALYICDYDGNKTNGNKRYTGIRNTTITIPEGRFYIRFYTNTEYYTGDICINVSNSNHNGEYDDYLSSVQDLSFITTIVDANSNVMFPYGLLSAGDKYDEITETQATKRIGIRAYESGDESLTTAITDGTRTYYQLTTAVTVTFSTARKMGYNAQYSGSEYALPFNQIQSSPVNAPIRISVKYPLDAVGTITNLPQNYMSVESMDAFTTELSSTLSTELGATVTITRSAFDTVNNRYNFNITVSNDAYYYGVQWQFDNEGNSTVTRVGNLAKHRTLPIQSQMKGCLLNADGTVNYYLYPNDWSKKADGVTASVLDGTDGDVMVEIPEFWYNYTETNGVSKLLVSDTQLSGDGRVWIRSPKHYLGAYKAQISSQGKLQSVAGTFAANSGHNNYNNTSATSLIDFRNYARAKDTNTYNWNVVTYWMRKTLWMLFVTEYANLDSQTTFTGDLTVDGYHQGGLGLGITQGTSTNSIGGYAQTITGYTNSYGNYSIGSLSLEATDMYGGATTVTANKKCRYRGIETPFGEVWEWTDGVFLNAYTGYEILDKSNYTKLINESYTGTQSIDCRVIGSVSTTSGGYSIKTILGTNYCDILAKTVSNESSGSTYYHDGWWIASGFRGSLFGGGADHMERAGLVYAYANYAPSYARAYLGSRLSYIP